MNTEEIMKQFDYMDDEDVRDLVKQIKLSEAEDLSAQGREAMLRYRFPASFNPIDPSDLKPGECKLVEDPPLVSKFEWNSTKYTTLKKGSWIGVDLDGTLAEYNGWVSETHLGAPIKPMANRVKYWLSIGVEVRIFTARVDGGKVAVAMGNRAGYRYSDVEIIVQAIQDWTQEHFGVRLPVTNKKDYEMVELWDNRVVRVVPNTGQPCCYGKENNHVDNGIRVLEKECCVDRSKRCSSSECAGWQWVPTDNPDGPTHGYCGRAGVPPEVTKELNRDLAFNIALHLGNGINLPGGRQAD